MKKLIIAGAGGHGRVVADIASRCGYESIAFLDDRVGEVESGFPDMPVTGSVADAGAYIGEADFFVAVGNNSTRERITLYLKGLGARMATLIHPQAVIGRDVSVGEGTAIMAGAVVNPCAVIGKGCIVNTGASVDHEDRIGDFSHVSVGAHLCGTVTLGERCFIGSGATVINNTDVCRDVTIGAGGTVIRSITQPGTYVGVPVRRIR
ncbi:MAG: acetyltransferase [Clostridia bacterium]|nr:acetyltransferase [Clostridia bacterium]